MANLSVMDKLYKITGNTELRASHSIKTEVQSISTKFDTFIGQSMGLPYGRFYEISGVSGKFKSTVTRAFFAKKILDNNPDAIVLDCDLEGTMNTSFVKNGETVSDNFWLARYNIDPNRWLLPANLGSAEEVAILVKQAIVSGVSCIIIDTLAHLMPRDVITRGESKSGFKLVEGESYNMKENLARATFISNFLGEIISGFSVYDRKGNIILVDSKILTEYEAAGQPITDPKVHKLSYYSCILFGINHLKKAPGVMYGDPNTTPGGAKITFAATMRFKIEKIVYSTNIIKLADNREVPEYVVVSLDVWKTKLSFAGGRFNVRVYADGRVEDDVNLLDVAVDCGFIEKPSARKYHYDGVLYDKKDIQTYIDNNSTEFTQSLDAFLYLKDKQNDKDETSHKVVKPKGLVVGTSKLKLKK